MIVLLSPCYLHVTRISSLVTGIPGFDTRFSNPIPETDNHICGIRVYGYTILLVCRDKIFSALAGIRNRLVYA